MDYSNRGTGRTATDEALGDGATGNDRRPGVVAGARACDRVGEKPGLSREQDPAGGVVFPGFRRGVCCSSMSRRSIVPATPPCGSDID